MPLSPNSRLEEAMPTRGQQEDIVLDSSITLAVYSYCLLAATLFFLLYMGTIDASSLCLVVMGMSFVILVLSLFFIKETTRNRQVPVRHGRLRLDAIQINPQHLQLMRLDRNFSPEDYERLLALDEFNDSKFEGASEPEINRLPTFTISASQLPNSLKPPKCSICLENFFVGDQARLVPCLHRFHPWCIDPWLRIKAVCPVCKFPSIG